MQHKLNKGNLLDEDGNLCEAGYDFSLSKTYNRKDIKAHKLRIKEWDYYYIGNDEYGLAFTIADNSYMSLVSLSLLDFANKKEVTKSIMSFMSKGKLNLPSSSIDGDVSYKNKKVYFTFINKNSKRHLSIIYKGLHKKINFSCEIDLIEINQNSMVIATPFDKKKHFYYNQKVNCLKASGYFIYGNKKYNLKNNTYGVLDWGRGVWTYKNTWYWSSLNALDLDNNVIGFNLGYGFGNTKNASENMVFFNKEAFKLEDVEFKIPYKKKNKEDFMKDWKIESKDKKIDLSFHPLLDRFADSNVLFIRSLQHQVFGIFNGTIKVKGRTIKIENLLGFAEKVFNKW